MIAEGFPCVFLPFSCAIRIFVQENVELFRKSLALLTPLESHFLHARVVRL